MFARAVVDLKENSKKCVKFLKDVDDSAIHVHALWKYMEIKWKYQHTYGPIVLLRQMTWCILYTIFVYYMLIFPF